MRNVVLSVCAAALLAACAGRPPAPVAVVQMHDKALDCSAIVAEVAANDAKLKTLGREEGDKVAQNIIAGTVGAVLFFPALFLMDFQNAAGKETAALQQRQSYLAVLAEQRGCGAAAAPVPLS